MPRRRGEVRRCARGRGAIRTAGRAEEARRDVAERSGVAHAAGERSEQEGGRRRRGRTPQRGAAARTRQGKAGEDAGEAQGQVEGGALAQVQVQVRWRARSRKVGGAIVMAEESRIDAVVRRSDAHMAEEREEREEGQRRWRWTMWQRAPTRAQQGNDQRHGGEVEADNGRCPEARRRARGRGASGGTGRA
jgi:hypothetical protein